MFSSAWINVSSAGAGARARSDCRLETILKQHVTCQLETCRQVSWGRCPSCRLQAAAAVAAAAAADYCRWCRCWKAGFTSFLHEDSHDLPAPAHGSRYCQACFQLKQFRSNIWFFPPTRHAKCPERRLHRGSLISIPFLLLDFRCNRRGCHRASDARPYVRASIWCPVMYYLFIFKLRSK